MIILIIETVPRPVNPIDAHVRNALEIASYLGKKGHICDVVFDSDREEKYRSDYDVILINYGSRYLDWRKYEKILKRNPYARIGWFTNEYNLAPNSSYAKVFKERGAFLLRNYADNVVNFKYFDTEYYINVNPILYKEFPQIPKTHHFIYWGTYRKDRVDYFRKYLNSLTHLSASNKNFKKFHHIGCHAKYIRKINWLNPIIRRFKYSLYFEDVFTHTNFNNLSNRFYEALGAGCVTLFDKNCINTLEQSEIDNWEDFIISDRADMERFIAEDFDILWQKQSQWMPIVAAKRQEIMQELEDMFLTEAGKKYGRKETHTDRIALSAQ